MKNFSIAIDGPAGAGKSSIAKNIAKQLGCIYIDTGAMYRSVGYFAVRQGIDLSDEESINESLKEIKLQMKLTEEGQQIYLNGENVSQAIRTSEIAGAASKVATYGEVREALVRMQREMAESTSVVMDGRDIGTVVLPNATLKIFLTATVDERAMRRYKEYMEQGVEANLEVLKEEIRQRDLQDSTRLISPLVKAIDAIEIDTTSLTITSTVSKITELLIERL